MDILSAWISAVLTSREPWFASLDLLINADI